MTALEALAESKDAFIWIDTKDGWGLARLEGHDLLWHGSNEHVPIMTLFSNYWEPEIPGEKEDLAAIRRLTVQVTTPLMKQLSEPTPNGILTSPPWQECEACALAQYRRHIQKAE